MPKCIECKHYNSTNKTCDSHGKSPIRKCIDAIINEQKSNIKNGMKVLEIGSGVNDYFRKMVTKNNATWYGLDRKEKWIKNRGVISGVVGYGQNVERYFEYNSFDYIYIVDR